ncbi:MAG: DNA-directed RNA polymerase subunit alpha [bacterium]
MFKDNWRKLIMPAEVKVEDKDSEGNYGVFSCAPLMRGYGTTIGNALRRIMISSICGGAVVAVRIDGVEQEFTTIPGVREDVVEIIMNLKQLRFKIYENDEHVLHLSVSKKGEVLAGDIEDTAQCKIVNKDELLFNIDKEQKMEMSIVVRTGRGYVQSGDHDLEDLPELYIPVDSFFSPVRRVNYKVTNARVKRDFNYDKLTFEVETDGTVTPRDALAYSAMILRQHTKSFINFTVTKEENTTEKDKEEDVNWDLYKSIDDIDLSVRSYNCLKNADIKYVGDMVQKTESEMLRTKNFGRKSLNELKLILDRMGLKFGMNIDSFPNPKILKKLEEK